MTTFVALAALLTPSQDFLGHTREVSSLALSADGRWLASGSVDLTVRIWDTKTRACARVLEGHDGEVLSLAFSPDGKTLASGERYKKVRFWDVEGGALKRTCPGFEGAVNGLAFTSGGTVLAACQDNNVYRIGPASAEAEKAAAHSYEVVGIAASNDGKVVATYDGNGTAALWNPSTLAAAGKLEHGDRGKCLAVSRDGAWLATGGMESPVKLWTTTDRSPVAAFHGPKVEANAMGFSPDGKRLVIGTQDNRVIVVDTADGSVKFNKEGHERPVTAVVVAHDGKSFYTASMDRTVKAWPMP